MGPAGAILLDRLGPPGFRFNDSGPRDWLFYQLYTRARALLARPWSARCYGVARPREGSRQNSIGGLGRAFTPAFRAGSLSLNPGRVAAEESGAARMVSAGAMLLDRLGPPGSEFRFIDFRPPRFALLSASRAREGAAGQAVVCPLLRGSSPTRGVAPKQHNKAIADQSPLLKLSLRRVRFQRTSTRQQLDCAKTLYLCSQENRRTLTSDGLSTCSQSNPRSHRRGQEFCRDPTRPSPNTRGSCFQGEWHRSVREIQLHNECAIDLTRRTPMDVT